MVLAELAELQLIQSLRIKNLMEQHIINLNQTKLISAYADRSGMAN